MGNVDAPRAILLWKEEDLSILSPKLILSIHFISSEIDPFSCTAARALQSLKEVKREMAELSDRALSIQLNLDHPA